MNELTRRRVTAFAIVGALIGAVPLMGAVVDAIEKGSRDAGHMAGAAYGVDVQGVLGAHDPVSGMEALDEMLSAAAADVPDSLSREAVVLPGAREVRLASDVDVLGYVVDRPVSTVEQSLRDAMERKGWTAIPLGGIDGYTFVKQEGEWVWILATCDEVGSSTSVTLRCRHR